MTQDETASLHLHVRLCLQQVPINIGFDIFSLVQLQ